MNLKEKIRPKMLIIHGQSAISPFRQRRLLEKLQRQNSNIVTINASYIYFIDIPNHFLTSEQKQKLAQLIQVPETSILAAQTTMHDSKPAILIVPRLGTISPWSSKATDIAHVCGIPLERIERGIIYRIEPELTLAELTNLADRLHDRMTESALFSTEQATQIFSHGVAKPLKIIPLLEQGISALQQANHEMGLALNEAEINYLAINFQQLHRNPTDVELMMFAQVNSEHCRHKIFNASFMIDGKEQPHSLFAMIKNTFQQNPKDVLSAYKDNAAILQGFDSLQFAADAMTHHYDYQKRLAPIVIKVETHNHPTAISPFAGAATGAGGEIRDEAAAGRGAKTKAGLVGYSVSHLRIPEFGQPWEMSESKPIHIASPLEIMLEAPIGAASFNNEFGRPNLCGYFRTFEMLEKNSAERWGYHKPIMIAGGLGTIHSENVEKKEFPAGAKLIVLGGPAMRIGLGGGAASSMTAGSGRIELDFASVQRSNPEMQRRAQEVINSCFALAEKNPILSIHDVGAGGLSNALPELIHGSARGGDFSLRAIPSAEPDMSPLEIWCNEAQERYVLAILEQDLHLFTEIAQRERCPFAVIGTATEPQQLILHDSVKHNLPIDMPLTALLGKPPQMMRQVQRENKLKQSPVFLQTLDLSETIKRVLQFPCVASKSFLITIGDRTVTGLVARDQMVGPWQIPVADVAVTAASYQDIVGEAMAMGERAPLALLNAKAAARMAIGEAITNIAAAAITDISQIRLSANWMAAAGFRDEDALLYDAVQTVGMEFCPALGICIPVGKDSLSMRTVWQDQGQSHSVSAPLSLIVSAFAPVADIRRTLTPQLISDQRDTELILLDLGFGKNRLGASVIAQVYSQLGDEVPDVDANDLKNFFAFIQTLNRHHLLLAYHDRSDGGLLATLVEMAFAGHTGITITLDVSNHDLYAQLFAEELGAVIQIKKSEHEKVWQFLRQFNLAECAHVIGTLNQQDQIIISSPQQILWQKDRITLQQGWSETSYRMQLLRDNPVCATQEFNSIGDPNNQGLSVVTTYDQNENIAAPYLHKNIKPKIAILREQGVNGHMEMAAAFDRAGFSSVDVHMSDILSGKISLQEFKGIAACGGFSYGDVLGAGTGWAQSILLNSRGYDEFATFFNRSDTFSLGVCNGCQMFSQLQTLIPGSELWPRFKRNISEQFEARFARVIIPPSPSIFFQGMAGSQLPIAVAHGEGYAEFANQQLLTQLLESQTITAQYIDAQGQPSETYPTNPNGSPRGITGLTTRDGRVTILMPHPERVFRTVQWSWHPRDWKEDSPWMRMFWNARMWVA